MNYLGLFVAIIFICTVYSQVSDDDVRVCYDHLVTKLRSMNGGFVTQEQGIDIANRVATQYLNGIPIEQITENLRNTMQEILEPEQVAIVTDVCNKTTAILGNRSVAEQLYDEAMQISMDFISADKQTIDNDIASLRAQSASDNEIKRSICQIMYTMITPEKRAAYIQQLESIIPANNLDAVEAELSRIMNLN